MNPTLNTIDVVVSDMDATIAFYAHLGLEFKLDPNTPEHAGCERGDVRAEHSIAFDSRSSRSLSPLR
ncbi:hypothetical protein ABZ897_50175 [Nonomuraea sp. NPDC046802]|uniref:hypothetical protein n=1 Tax=Nonomuraea sp. NPDC046802 TaxID=3154919 RepID=UPI0033DBE70B